MVNNTIKDIDVQCNRMSEECLAEILKGLKNNTTLEILRVSILWSQTSTYKLSVHVIQLNLFLHIDFSETYFLFEKANLSGNKTLKVLSMKRLSHCLCS